MSHSFQYGESIETPAQHTEYLRRNEHRYRRHFRDYDSYEVFMMLPLDERGRERLLCEMYKQQSQEAPCETFQSSQPSPQAHIDHVYFGAE